MEIWINPECSKCRSALDLLEEAGAGYTVRHYLQDPPTAEEVREVLKRLGLEPWDITRLGEPVAGELGLAGWARGPEERERWVAALAAHPVLIQRPIITLDEDTAVVARTPEAVEAAVRATAS
ncbi:ArsC/Spx/MgsR family protein [Nonomuraea sp. NPDC050310]|uniref:ArsC/Spx/MgsR family protein n=1 Tax=unclassified Nonomuraea TaxID=2593643 RepID=UPI0033E5F925